ncbi:sprouty-related, EVH1 domain-containing protein 3 isoform X1 [Peromyscus californicus insignis]|uniref:sprouty-related, EVH1 domain-containing protein 3 isoform X1 n=1 Tax=Peromyscus californicus insignis TaxID=564181 RepID=UPI0022A715DD|nr:sprouty-related, EVH1 domain-containing protein 3 isoform X1 [Peromyscus californicus insignis]
MGDSPLGPEKMGAIRGVRCSPSRALGPSGQVRPLCSYPSPKPPPPPPRLPGSPSLPPRPGSRCPSPAPPEPARERERTGGGGGRVAAARSPAGASQTTLECTLRPGLVYNKVNPIFHHWSLGDCKFGLTFQSPAEADEFQKSLLAALAALSRGSLTPSSSSSSSSPSQDTAETPCPLMSHVDSDSSSSHSRQETPATAAAAPIVTVESTSAFPPATPPQLRRSSAQSYPPLLPFTGIPEPSESLAGAGSQGWGGRGYEDYRRSGLPAPLPLSTCVVGFAKTGALRGAALGPPVSLPAPLTEATPPAPPARPPPGPGPTPAPAKASPEAEEAARCVHCRALFRRRADGRGGRCAEAPDPGRLLVRRLSCLWCAESLLYHCLSDAEGDFSDPCACEPGHPRPAARWAALAALSLAVPCLCCYAPLRACHWVAARCGCAGCGGRHEEAAR